MSFVLKKKDRAQGEFENETLVSYDSHRNLRRLLHTTAMALFTTIVILLAATAAAILTLLRRRSPISLPGYKGEGSLAFLHDAKAFATKPIALIQKATRQCGDVFSIQVLSVYNVWLRGNQLNKVYLETREDVWSFVGGMVREVRRRQF